MMINVRAVPGFQHTQLRTLLLTRQALMNALITELVYISYL